MGWPEYATPAAGSDNVKAVDEMLLAKQERLPLRPPYAIRHRGVFIALITWILIGTLFNLGISIWITLWILSQSQVSYQGETSLTFTATNPIIAGTVLFWCTIPFLATGLVLFELIQVSRRRLPSRWLVTSAAVCAVLWALQCGLETTCVFEIEDTICPWSLTVASQPGYNWVTAASVTLLAPVPWVTVVMLCMYVVYFSLAMRGVVLDKRDWLGESAAVPAARMEDSLSLHTLPTSLSPDTETLVTDSTRPSTFRSTMHSSLRTATRPPSYFSNTYTDESFARDETRKWESQRSEH